MSSTEIITSIILIKLIWVSLGTARNSRLSLHDALPIFAGCRGRGAIRTARSSGTVLRDLPGSSSRNASHQACKRIGSTRPDCRSEEHTSELQSHSELVCRPMLEKKNCYRYSNNPETNA